MNPKLILHPPRKLPPVMFRVVVGQVSAKHVIELHNRYIHRVYTSTLLPKEVTD